MTEHTPPVPPTVTFDRYPFLAPPQAADEIGRLGPYRVLGVLGRGGMGVVFAADEPALGRRVALKVMLPQFAHDPPARARFVREGKAQAAVEHEHVAAIHAVGEDRGVPYLAMPLLKGTSLSDALKTGVRAPVAEAVRIAREAAEGLAAAHAKGLVHRDIKPANVWLEGPKRRVKILDFGLARVVEAGGDPADPVTGSGVLVGTPAYMSPEQANGYPVDFRTDLFSLGAVLYELLAGRRPFAAPTPLALLVAVASEAPPPPSATNPQVPPRLDRAVAWLMAKAPADRPPTALAAAEVLRTVEADLANTAVIPAAGRHDPDPFSGLDAVAFDPTTVAGRAGHGPGGGDSPRGRGGSPGVLLAAGLSGLLALAGAGFLVVKAVNRDGAAVPPSGGDPPAVRVRPTAPKASPPGPPPADPDPDPNPEVPGEFRNALGMKFVRVPGGTGWLGGVGGQPGRDKVVIPADFYLGKYEVTQAEWAAVTGANPSHFARDGGGRDVVREIPDATLRRFPVENVSWDDCQEFIGRLNGKAAVPGWVYRLPTEAEWEYACRGGPGGQAESGYDFYFAKPTNTLLPDQANFNNVLKRTCRVGSYEPNRLGLYDLHGNVWEYREDAGEAADGALLRVARGGCWSNDPGFCRAVYRGMVQPSHRDNLLGLRLARVPSPPAGQ